MFDLPPSGVVFRVDARLVHSALTHAWLPYLAAKHLVIADAELARDPRRRAIAKLSVPEDVECHFVSETDHRTISDVLAKGHPTLVVFKSLTSVLRAFEAGVPMWTINVGHIPQGYGRTEVCPSVCLGSGDVAIISHLRRHNVEVDVRALPEDGTLDLRASTSLLLEDHDPQGGRWASGRFVCPRGFE